MPQVCRVCRLPNRHEAEEAILAGEPFRRIAARFGASATALRRHKEAHLPAKLIKVAESREVDSAESLTDTLQWIEAEARRLGQKAEKAGDTRTALAAIREHLRTIELKAKMWAARQQQQASAGQGATPEMSPERRLELTLLVWSSDYSDDPAAFLEKLRDAAARDYVYRSGRSADQPALTYAEARAMLEARERPQARIGPAAIEEAEP